ncbi:hypothetical protein I4U23_024757 [Adineta vaga]|nr:hypothetical protein I4U23_024757 [Adineta vaga]
MTEPTVLNYIQISVLVLILLLALIYLIPILFIPRFHSINNVFTVNLCIATMCCSIYWISNFISLIFYPSTLSVPLAIVTTSFHRLCSIVYHTKPYFKKKRWAMLCISSQWLAGMILSLPRISFNDSACDSGMWRRIYTLTLIVIIPALICLVINILIFQHVRSSTNRVQPSFTTGNENQYLQINRRDLYLLRHMIISFCIFLGGWSPVYLYNVIVFEPSFVSIISSICVLLAELSLLLDIIDLYLYNHELRRYFREKLYQHY